MPNPSPNPRRRSRCPWCTGQGPTLRRRYQPLNITPRQGLSFTVTLTLSPTLNPSSTPPKTGWLTRGRVNLFSLNSDLKPTPNPQPQPPKTDSFPLVCRPRYDNPPRLSAPKHNPKTRSRLRLNSDLKPKPNPRRNGG